ncbi:putative glutaredoxin Grx1 [Piedraia hortae CBS 480.64]|uniref:Putative glutaredoxin Grx1 n=1 Tax=Piedraia hortae CBS 480.64 TaxID=1314780 RepID=A0A6A7C0C4_9PEZI|nr:putative glutaredoxin Grx1 [Piedraia hortae CBS 480.64]
MSPASKDKIQQIIDNHGVVVFSKSYCPYCQATKALLQESGANAHVIELDEIDDGSEMQNNLQEMTGQRTVPNIFIGRKHIGGNSDLQARKNELPQLLKSIKS